MSSDFSDEELEKLGFFNRFCFENSLCEFHEASNPLSIGYDIDDNDNGSTVFAYTETRRYM